MSDLKRRILEMAKQDLEDIEAALKEHVHPELQIVSDIAGHILFAGGKRLRPLLGILSARICGFDKDFDRAFSTVFEYLHAATLLHDDLVDGADLRRGKTVAHSIWGNSEAVLVGDFLLARSLSIAAKTANCDVIALVAEVTQAMAQGEIHQLSRIKSLDISEEEYMQIIRRKTAVVFRGVCRMSALIAGVGEKKKNAVSDFGHHLGIAFQMADDLLDYTCNAQSLGKNPGADLAEGKLTLPVIHALKSAPRPQRAEIEKIIMQDAFSNDEFNALTDLLRRFNGIQHTRRMAERHVAQAKEALSVFEESSAKTLFLMIADYVLDRNA